jgi:putative transposase
MNWEHAHRLCMGVGPRLPQKRPRRRIASTRPRPALPTGPNTVRAHDFVFDACATGQPIKCLTVIDEFAREYPAIDVAGSIRSNRVIEVLSRLVSARGAPRYMRSDNGPEFASHAILKWIADSTIQTALNDPGKPWQNGTDENFNGRLRDECLNQEWFRSRHEARVLIENWRRHYNEVRPHSSLQYMTPVEFHQQDATSTNPGAALK